MAKKKKKAVPKSPKKHKSSTGKKKKVASKSTRKKTLKTSEIKTSRKKNITNRKLSPNLTESQEIIETRETIGVSSEKESGNELLKKLVNSSIEETKKKKETNIDKKPTHDKEDNESTTEEVNTVKKRKKRKNKIKTWEEKAQSLPTFQVSEFPKLPVKNILITQNKPTDLQNPYQLLTEKYQVKIHFHPFVKVEGLSSQEFRNQKVDILSHQNIIFTSRLAIDHFFRIINEMRINLPDTTKFFCLNEQIAYYMQKYVEFRKRRIFWGQGTIDDLKTVLKKNIGSKFLLPASDTIKDKIIGILNTLNAKYTAVDVYKTVPENIRDINPEKFDIIAFFTPIAVDALKKFFPTFKQNKTRFAAYSILTAKRIQELGYRVDIYAPTIEFPSMVNAIAHYLLHVRTK